MFKYVLQSVYIYKTTHISLTIGQDTYKIRFKVKIYIKNAIVNFTLVYLILNPKSYVKEYVIPTQAN